MFFSMVNFVRTHSRARQNVYDFYFSSLRSSTKFFSLVPNFILFFYIISFIPARHQNISRNPYTAIRDLLRFFSQPYATNRRKLYAYRYLSAKKQKKKKYKIPYYYRVYTGRYTQRQHTAKQLKCIA